MQIYNELDSYFWPRGRNYSHKILQHTIKSENFIFKAVCHDSVVAGVSGGATGITFELVDVFLDPLCP